MTGPRRIALPGGAVLVTAAPPAAEAPPPLVAAATLAVPLAGAGRAAALAAPLAAFGWARSVTALARRAGAAVRAEPVTTADFTGLTLETPAEEARALGRLADWFAELPHHPPPSAVPAGAPTAEHHSDPLRRALFGSGHRYAIGHDERSEYLASRSPEGIHADAAGLLGRAPVVALSHAAPATVDALAAALSAAVFRPAPATVPLPARPPVSRTLPAGPGRAWYLLGTAGVPLASPAKYALHVAWAVAGGRGGLLDRSLRRGRALTYSLAAFSREFAEGGYCMCAAACEERVAAEVAERVRAVLQGLAEEAIAPGLLEPAKEQLIVRGHQALETARGTTERLVGYEVAGVPAATAADYAAHIARVTPGQVRDAFRWCLDPPGHPYRRKGEAP
ncbi:insulinase family protein [Streptomyces orinoci]|uniref:Insulinase family protein n=1 Tax=Streptomyces orinoci TaxID=67339 RepID=A0ABV3JQK8_STRON|nr:insulinase family protein [Streptomyces orinoci]